MTTIKLHNTKTRKKEVFEPISKDDVRMYVCGPTVYDRAHIGNARPVIVFDVLYRLLRHVYGADHVTYVRNFTDVDDKINATALARQEAGASGTLEELISERTEETIDWYLKDMGALGALEPDHAPRATKYIAEMREMIEELITKGFAYTATSTMGHNSNAQYVYADSTALPEHAFLSVDEFDRMGDAFSYGELSGRSTDDMISGSRAEVGEGKRNPMDSVLWKPSTVEQPGWESPWGRGRPGWHIECSAMSRKLLGKQFDIHGGGLDLLFPHHENELAQCVACDGVESSARHWMHNEMLQVEGKKMSKSLGNFFTVRDLLEQGVPGEVIRFVMLSTHYRKPMDWTEEKAKEAEKFLRQCATVLEEWSETKKDRVLQRKDPADPSNELVDVLKDDLNSSMALTHLRFLASKGTSAPEVFGGQLHRDLEFLGFLGRHWSEWFDEDPDDLAPLALFLSEARSVAMETQDFSEVDRLKAALVAAGIEVRMTKSGVEVARKQLDSLNTAYARANRAVATEDDDDANFWFGIAKQMQTGMLPCKENQELKIQALIEEWKL